VITGWVVKVALGIALFGLAVVELGSPFIAKAQADDAAHQIANQVAFRLKDSFTNATLEAACTEESQSLSVELKTCAYDESASVVRVTVVKHARSFVLVKISALRHFYEVEVSATATPK